MQVPQFSPGVLNCKLGVRPTACGGTSLPGDADAQAGESGLGGDLLPMQQV